MYYYKTLDQKRGNYKSYVVHPDTVGSLTRTHKIIAVCAANERVQSSIMQIAYNIGRADIQRSERRAKR